MWLFTHPLLLFFLSVLLYSCYAEEFVEELVDGDDKWPTIAVSILVRNKAPALPYFLSSLHELDYPKDRLRLWIYTDQNSDNSLQILEEWTRRYSSEYNRVYVSTDNAKGPVHDDNPSVWTPERLRHVIKLREQALNFARKMWADYIFMIDADVFLTDPMTLKSLVGKNLPVVAPMLISDGLYSNFWGGMTDKYYYKRTEDYEGIRNRDNVGCFEVPMVHTAVLINLKMKKSDVLTYDPRQLKEYDGPEDDIITFAVNAKRHGIKLSVCNDHIYGYVPIPVDSSMIEQTNETEQILNVKLEALGHGTTLPLDNTLAKYITHPEKSKVGLDHVFVINLERRVKRREIMQRSLEELGVDAEFVNAVDGKKLDIRDLRQFSVTLMPIYQDPYHKRPMKSGEVGCFLSHYNIWKEIAKKHIKTSLVLEDDVHFRPFFRRQLRQLMAELDELDWEFVYIGRKILQDGKEEFVSPHVTRPLYSYWTLGYIISEAGARKLIKAEPLAKMLPVDEFLPIMFDEHPNDTWKSFFPKRNLKGYSASPLLIQPTHYTGQTGYISDTEDSAVLPPESPRPADTLNEAQLSQATREFLKSEF